MTTEQLDAIEAGLGFALPELYRRVAMTRPFRPLADHDHIYWFFDDPNQVIGESLVPQAAGAYQGPRLPSGSLAIGFSECGDTYVLDSTTPGMPVHSLSHESHQIEPDYPTFEAFVTEWIEAPEQIRALTQSREASAKAEHRAMMRRAGRIIFLGFLVVIVLPLLILSLIVWSNERRRHAEGPLRRVDRAPVVPGAAWPESVAFQVEPA